MKGQLNIEFIVSVLVFLLTVMTISISVIGQIPNIHARSVDENIKATGYQILHLLMFDEGYSKDFGKQWHLDEFSDVMRLGLSSGRMYELHGSKISSLDSNCGTTDEYERVKSMLGLDYRLDVIINATNVDNAQNLLYCAPQWLSRLRNIFWTESFATVNNDIVILRVGIVK
jgi:hypothetical protein